MDVKKIEEMDFYEILNVNPKASLEEIKKAYHLGVNTYHRNSIATHGLLPDEERQKMLKKIEEAYQTLKNPKKRSKYDSQLKHKNNPFPNRTSPRKTTLKLIIEDAEIG